MQLPPQGLSKIKFITVEVLMQMLSKISLQKSVAFLHTNNEQIEKEYRKTIPLTIASKNSNT
jgi:hypothetical protein